jgi:hypothetical protein
MTDTRTTEVVGDRGGSEVSHGCPGQGAGGPRTCRGWPAKAEGHQMTPEQRAKDLIDRDWEYFDSGTHSVMYGELEKLIAATLREAENAAYDKAIRAVEVMGSGWMNDDQESGWRAAEEAAIAAIRSLKGE